MRGEQRGNHASLAGFQRGEVHNSIAKGVYPFPIPGNENKKSPSKNEVSSFGINKNTNPFTQQPLQQNSPFGQNNNYNNSISQKSNPQDNTSNFLQRRQMNLNNG